MRERASPRRPAAEPLLVALLAGAAGVAGSFAVAGFTPAFVAGPIAGALARRLPAAIVTFSILVLGDLGEQLNVLLSLGLATGLLGLPSFVGRAIGERVGRASAGSAVAAVGGTAVAFFVTAAPLPSLVAGLAVGAVHVLASLGAATVPAGGVSSVRRGVIAGAVGTLAFTLGGYALGSRAGPRPAADAGGGDEDPPTVQADIEAKLELAAERSLDVAGLEPLVSDEFYTVDINATDPALAADDWTLSVTGAVDEPLSYSYDDVRARDAEHRFVSLRCVGEALNGRKMDNALWTGIPLMDLVEPAGVSEGCCVMLRAADGFYEEFPLAALRDGFLAYGMNGGVLPRAHGHPARALIPGHWGEINVKWLTEVEVLEREAEGYWEKRGWHGTGPVNTVAKLHAQNRLDDGRLEVGGHAYAGTRGIESVEVSTDGGGTWAEAVLSAPLPGDDVWRQWVYRYDPPAGAHEVVVRATDGTGALQPRERASAFPSGPTGWVSRTVRS